MIKAGLIVAGGAMAALSLTWQAAAETTPLEELRQRAEIDGDWRRLEIVMPNPLDEIYGSGLGSACVAKIGGRTWRMYVPVGCWLKVNIRSHQRLLENVIQFKGEAVRWTFTTDGPRVMLSKDGGDPEVVGITLVEGSSPESWFIEGDVPFAESLSVEFEEVGQVTHLSKSPVPVSAILATGYELTTGEIAAFAEANPRALAIDLDYELVNAFKYFEGSDLESCSFEPEKEPQVRDGNKLADYPVELPSLPKMKYFSSFFTVIPGDYMDSLAEKTPNLRTMTVSASNQRATFSRLDGLSRLKHLEALNATWGSHVSTGELLKLPKLRVFRTDASTFLQRDPSFARTPELDGLLSLVNRVRGFPEKIMNEWADSGALKNLIELETYRAIDFRKTPELEILRLRRYKNHQDAFDIETLGGLEHLWFLKLNDPSQEEIERIGALPNADQIRSLQLYSGNCHDLTPLESLTGLRRLELQSLKEGGIEEIDLRPFKHLESIVVRSIPTLHTIRGLNSHPTLMRAWISSCPEIRDLGPPFTNTKLRTIELYSLDHLTDLKFLSGARQLNQVNLRYCDGLTEPLGIDLDAIDLVLVYRCGELEDRLPGQ